MEGKVINLHINLEKFCNNSYDRAIGILLYMQGNRTFVTNLETIGFPCFTLYLEDSVHNP
jgi:hypothetical protein